MMFYRFPLFRIMLLVTRRVRRNRRSGVGGDGYSRSRLQLELADSDHAIAWLQPAKDFGPAVDAVAGAHESSHDGQTGLAVILFLLGDEENRVAVKRIIDRC